MQPAQLPCPYCSSPVVMPSPQCPSCGLDPTAARVVCKRCQAVTPKRRPQCIRCGLQRGSELPGKIAIIVVMFLAAFVLSIVLHSL